MEFKDFLIRAVESGASDLFLIAGGPLCNRVNKEIVPLTKERLTAKDCEQLISAMYRIADRPINQLKERGDDKFSFSIEGLARFRMSAYLQRGSMAAVIRIVTFGIPSGESMGIPEQVLALADGHAGGLVLLTGAARSGRSTTLACLIDRINKNYHKHIITIEDPIEYLHRDEKSLVSQREVGIDTSDLQCALLGALQQSPDVIALGELDGAETIRTALKTAEMGNLVFAVMNIQDIVYTMERLVNVFPREQRDAIWEQLGTVLKAVVSQQLLPGMDGNLIPVFEILYADKVTRPLICQGKSKQLSEMLAAGNLKNILSLDESIFALYQSKKIGRETALKYAENSELMKRKMWVIDD